jgi:hypothetical protein
MIINEGPTIHINQTVLKWYSLGTCIAMAKKASTIFSIFLLACLEQRFQWRFVRLVGYETAAYDSTCGARLLKLVNVGLRALISLRLYYSDAAFYKDWDAFAVLFAKVFHGITREDVKSLLPGHVEREVFELMERQFTRTCWLNQDSLQCTS